MDDKPLVFSFAEFTVREREYSVLREDAALRLEPKSFRVLVFLLRNPQRLIPKEELLDAVWPDAVVQETSLSRAISQVRRALGDDPRNPRFLETVSTIGYRWCSSVQVVDDQPPKAPDEAPDLPPSATVSAPPDVPPAQFTPTQTGDATGPLPVSASSGSPMRRAHPGRLVGAALVLAALAATGIALWQHSKRTTWARTVATTEAERLLEAGDYPAAANLAQSAIKVLPDDPSLTSLWSRATGDVSIDTNPRGAEVAVRPYLAPTEAFTVIGQTPMVKTRLPRQGYVFRLTAPGYAAQYIIDEPAPAPQLVGDRYETSYSIDLRRASTVPPEMVPVPGGWSGLTYPLQNSPYLQLPGFLIDRYEVTNKDYKRFVDAGGYSRPEFWQQDFVLNGRKLSFAEAMSRFHDATGRPGPATWEAGSYPNGREQYPVAGVSWYEAAAYAVFAQKSLPTAWHWMRASQAGAETPIIAAGSNFHGEGAQPVGAPGSMSGYGTSDMAGNVKEWCLNATADGKRFILGGGFAEPDYMFNFMDAQPPWDRRPNFGLRLAKLDEPLKPEAAAVIEARERDYSNAKPVNDELYRIYAAMYSYDPAPLNPRVEQASTQGTVQVEKVSFDAAYSHERMTAYLFLPAQSPHPLETVVFFPGGMATLDNSLDLSQAINAYDFILKSGRAFVIPVYKGMYERRDGFIPGRNPPRFLRDHIIAWSRDLSRTLDYLETRPGIDARGFAFLGFSMGGSFGPILLANEQRFNAAIFLSAGFQMKDYLPEADTINFASRMKTPVLVLNGRYDGTFPLESSQKPFFRWIGTPPAQKKLVIFEGGHGVFPRPAAVRECLDWLDRYLGPVHSQS